MNAEETITVVELSPPSLKWSRLLWSQRRRMRS
jgi:hypothetical protein